MDTGPEWPDEPAYGAKVYAIMKGIPPQKNSLEGVEEASIQYQQYDHTAIEGKNSYDIRVIKHISYIFNKKDS